jgi:hypothetical protein
MTERTFKIRFNKSHALDEWQMKEEGSYEDYKRNDNNHPWWTLGELLHGKTATLTETQVRRLIESGDYHATAWEPDEIDGGKKTMKTIAAKVAILEAALNPKA